ATIGPLAPKSLGPVAVAPAGDTNGDGIDDLAVLSASVFVFTGPVVDTTTDSAAATFSTASKFGLESLVGIGDQDGDGYDDLAMSEYYGPVAIVLSPTTGAVDYWDV